MSKVDKKQHALVVARFLKAQDRLVYQTADLSLSSLAGMLKTDSKGRAAIDLAPDFQRRQRWGAEKQSALIESFLLNVPVPPIYLAEDSYGQYSVVDGKQRLTAIHSFMVEGLKLKDLENFVELEGTDFEGLPDDLKNALNIRPYVRVVTLLKQSDPDLKFEVFTRLNRGGEQMLPQEVRKVAYRGGFSDLIYQLAESPFLKRQLKISSDKSPAYTKMEDAEYVLRFFALHESWQHFSGSLRDELDACMVRHMKDSPAELRASKEKFQVALGACEEIWGDHAFQRYTGNAWRDQFLGGVYDAQILAVAQLSAQELRVAKANGGSIIKKTARLFQDETFERIVRQGTNNPSFVRDRVNRVLSVLRKP